MVVDFNALMPAPEVIEYSIRGVKTELHKQKALLVRHSQCKRTTCDEGDTYKYFSRGATIARAIRRLDQIIVHLQVMKIISHYQRLVDNNRRHLAGDRSM
jgi:hypothetical protein